MKITPERVAYNEHASSNYYQVLESILYSKSKSCTEDEARSITSTVFNTFLELSDDKVEKIYNESPTKSFLYYLLKIGKNELIGGKTNYKHKKKVQAISSDKLQEGADCKDKSQYNSAQDESSSNEIQSGILYDAMNSIECEIERDIYRSFKLELLTIKELCEIHSMSKSGVYRIVDDCDVMVREYCLSSESLGAIEEDQEDEMDDLFEYNTDY